MRVKAVCSRCTGAGEVLKSQCSRCGGTGAAGYDYPDKKGKPFCEERDDEEFSLDWWFRFNPSGRKSHR